jgi:hypothetical protein
MPIQILRSSFPKDENGNPYRPIFNVPVDSAGNAIAGTSLAGTQISSTSGNVAAASASATLAGVVAKTTYINQFEVTGGGATAGSIVTMTVTGLLGGTQSYNIAVPTGAALGITPMVISFFPPWPASAVNTAIVVTVPSLGAGNTNAVANARGFQA